MFIKKTISSEILKKNGQYNLILNRFYLCKIYKHKTTLLHTLKFTPYSNHSENSLYIKHYKDIIQWYKVDRGYKTNYT